MEDIDKLEIYYDYSPYLAQTEKESVGVRKGFIYTLSKIPASIRKLISDPATAEYLYALVKSGQLNPEQAQTLSAIVRKFVVGDIFIKDLADTISSRLKLNPDSTTKLLNRLIAELLLPVIEDVKNVQKKNFEGKLVLPVMPPIDINKGNVLNLRK